MKRKLFNILSIVAMSFSLASCIETGESSEEIPEVSINDLKVENYSSKNKVSNKKDVKIVDSFYDDNDNWYYVIEVGSIARMPLQNMSNSGMIRWTQNSTSYKRTVTSSVTDTTSMKEIVENQVTNAVSNSVEDKIKQDTSLSVEAKFKPFNLVDTSVKATHQITVESLWKSNASYESKFKSSYEKVSSRTQTETITETIEFDSNCPTGYYGWNLCGNVKVYSFVIYNELSQIVNISYVADIVSSTWCFDYLTDEEFDNITLNFDYNEYINYDLPELNAPEKYFDVDAAVENMGKNMVNVSFDAAGGYCNQKLFIAEGSKYDKLPIPTYNKEKYFAGWYDSLGNKVTNDSICIFGEDHTLTARWGSAVHSVTIGDFVLEEPELVFGIKFSIHEISFEIDKEQLIASGYTKYKIRLEYNVRGGVEMNDGIDLGFELAGINLGSISQPVNTQGKNVDSTYTSGYNIEFLTSNLVDGSNKLKLTWQNDNDWHLTQDRNVYFTGFKVTITFYNPDQE